MSRKILTYKAVSVLLGTSLVMSAYADTYAQNLYTTEYYENDITVMSDNGAYIDTDNFVDFDYAFEGVSEGYDTDNSVNGNAVSNQGERGVPCFWNNDGKYSMEYQTDRGYMNNYVITTGGKSGIIYVGEIEEVQAIGGITLRGSSSENNSTYKVYAMDTSEFDFSAAPSFENAELIASGTMNAADSSWYKKVDDNAAVMEDFSISGQMGIFVEITATSGANYDGMSFSMRNIYNVRDLNAVSDDGKVTLSWTPPVSGLVENVIVSYFNGSQEIKTDVVPASDGILFCSP